MFQKVRCRRTTRNLLLCAALWVSSALANSEESPNGRFYGSFGLGWNYAEPLKLGGGAVIDYDVGMPAASLALGVNAFDRWRFELEAMHQEDAPEVLYFRGTDIEFDTPHKDRLQATSLLVNAIRDFRLGIAFRPYLGLGAGPARVGLRFNILEDDGNEITVIDDSAWTFALQGIAGVTIPLGQRLALGMEYRYWRAPSLNLEDVQGNEIDGQQSIHSGWLRLNYQPAGYAWGPAADSQAADPTGFYLGASIGGGMAVDRDFLGKHGQMDAFAIGPMGSISAGYRISKRWQIELEAARRNNRMQIYDLLISEQRTTGDVQADSLLANLIYRFRPSAAINPKIGIGLGMTDIRYDLDLAGAERPLIDDADKTTAFQWMMGFDISLTPRWMVSTDYRLWWSDDVTFDLEEGGTVKVTHLVHSWSVGLRYSIPR